jgi:hypothetical protein
MATGPADDGAAMFARYAYPPNELGYCGSGNGGDLLEFAHQQGDLDAPTPGLDMVERARAFDGAWPYLEYLADVAGSDSVMDRRVVEAYWVGNDLLRAGDPAHFANTVRSTFASQLGADWPALTSGSGPEPLANHCFHVFTIYPWIGVLRRSGAEAALRVLDRCRIRWGRVDSVEGEVVGVQCRPLTWSGSELRLGAPRPERARLAANGLSLAGTVRPGSWVSLHWDWVCDELNHDQLKTLLGVTNRQLAITNRVSVATAQIGSSEKIRSTTTPAMFSVPPAGSLDDNQGR